MNTEKRKPAEQILIQFCKGYEKRDLASLLKLCTQNINVWGTGLDEYRVGLKEVEEQFKRDWSQSDKGEIEIVSFVPAPTDANWAAAICNAKLTIDGQEHLFEHLRGTIIVEKENDQWKISHFHSSFPDYRNAENASFPAV
jgi:hypothetical protein